MNWSSAIRAIGVRSRQPNGMPVWNGVVKRLESVMMMVWASPFLPLTSRKPSAPAPPPLLTTMIGRGRRHEAQRESGREFHGPTPCGARPQCLPMLFDVRCRLTVDGG